MNYLTKLLLIAIFSLALAACDRSTSEIATNVKASMQQKFDSDEAFKTFSLKISTVTLVKESGNKYQGIATVLSGSGNEHRVTIDVVADGQNLIWHTENGAFLFLAQEALKQALGNTPATTPTNELPPLNPDQRAVQSEPSRTQQLQWDKPTTLSGKLRNGVFENCCFNGVSSKDSYTFLEVDAVLEVDADAVGQPRIDDVRAVQLEVALPGVDIGQRVTIACSSISHGDTGHYALPVYCNDPQVRK